MIDKLVWYLGHNLENGHLKTEHFAQYYSDHVQKFDKLKLSADKMLSRLGAPEN
jgi:hypothetical protein